MTQTYVFGGQPAQPSMVSYSALALTADTQLQWPWVDQDTTQAVPLWLDVTPTGAYSILMPDATGAANGQAVIIFNVGASTITILDSTGMSITTITTGVAKYILLRDNSTAGGAWRVTTLGAGTSAADAGTLAGYGLSALSGATLNSNDPVVALTTNATADTTYRAQVFEVTAATGAGTLSFASTSTLGNGWWMGFSNLGTGAWTLDPNGAETIDGQSTIVLNPTETCLIFSSGSALFTIGRGRSVDFIYTALNKDVSGNTDVTLTTTEASNLLIKFFGTLTGNINVIVPSVVNEYMIRNATSGSYTITIKTASGAGVIATQSQQAFIKCDGTDCFNVVTNIPTGNVSMADGSVSLPGMAFTNEPSTGFYRPSSGVMGISVLGAQIFHVSSAGLAMNALPITGLSGLTLTSTDAGASAGPTLTLWRDSASPAASDVLGYVAYDGQNSTPAEVTYAATQATILDPTASSEDATFDFLTRVAGSLAKRAFIGQGLVVGAGTDNGPGTITATAGIAGTTGTFSDAVAITRAGTGLTVTTTDQTHDVALMQLTDAGALVGPILELYRHSASPAASDVIGAVSLTGDNSTPAAVTYAQIVASILDPTAASEDAKVLIKAMVAGALTSILTVGPGVQVGAPTGGDQGAGTVNVSSGFFVNGSRIGAVPVRQTVLSAAVDSNGLPNFITAGTGLSVNIAATSVPIYLTASNGFSATGGVDLIGAIAADTTIGSLTNNATNYLYATIAADGTCTLAGTTLAPVYQWGGTYSTTSGQFTFDIQAMVGKVGTGSGANQAYRVFIGEAVTSGGSVTSVVNYALLGRWRTTGQTVSNSATLTVSHNLGVQPFRMLPAYLVNISSELNYSVGDRIQIGTGGAFANSSGITVYADRNTISINQSSGIYILDKSTHGDNGITVAKWNWEIQVERGW